MDSKQGLLTNEKVFSSLSRNLLWPLIHKSFETRLNEMLENHLAMARKQIIWPILFYSLFLFLWSTASSHWTNIVCAHLRLEIFCFAAALLTAFNINSDLSVFTGRRTGTCSTLALENTETFCLLLKVLYLHHLTGHSPTSHEL